MFDTWWGHTYTADYRGKRSNIVFDLMAEVVLDGAIRLLEAADRHFIVELVENAAGQIGQY